MQKNLRAMELAAVMTINLSCLILMGLCYNQIYNVLEKSQSSILDNLAYVILLLTSIASVDKIFVYMSHKFVKVSMGIIILADIGISFVFLYLYNWNVQPLEVHGYKLFGTYWLTILTLVFNIGACVIDIGEFQKRL